jgi:hypothetical protein
MGVVEGQQGLDGVRVLAGLAPLDLEGAGGRYVVADVA